MTIKVVVLGGSGVATPELAEALHQISGRTQAVELALVGRSAEKLEKVAAAARYLAGKDALLSVSATTDLEAALSGADYVLNQMRIGGLEARVFDETFPNELGIPGEETTGPGGFVNAVRTIPVVLEYARKCEQICPAALMVSFTNPSSLVQYAITRTTRLQTIGLCDVPVTMKENISRALGVPEEELRIDYVGMHHFGWVNGIWRGEQDLLPEALANAGQITPEVEPALVQAYGAIPCAYFGYFFHPERMLAKKLGKRTRAAELLELQEEILSEYQSLAQAEAQGPGANRPAALAKRKAKWYRVIIAPVLAALIETGRGGSAQSYRFVINLVNGTTVPWLPPDAIVEVPAEIRDGNITALPVRSLPEDVIEKMRTNCLYERMAVEAIISGDRALALRALLLNPMIHTYDQAAQVLERAWPR